LLRALVQELPGRHHGPQDHAVRWASPEHLSEGLMNSLSTPTRYAQWRKEAHDYFLVTEL
jgi:hypothetical protein